MKRWLGPLFIFIGLTFLFTYPTTLYMSNSVPGLGDPLLNSWIMAWDCHQLFRNPLELFEANHFFPEPHSLAYSEHLFASALIALPVYVLSDNAILAYNFVQFMSFVLAGLGMFLLVDYLTGNWWAALLSGIIFAFCPYKFGQIWHLQMLTAQWMPFTFLFLHKFTRTSRWRDLGLFTLFFILQILSSTYYGLFLTFGVGLYVLYIILLRMGKGIKPFMLKIALSAIIVLVIAGPFFIPYYKLKKEMGFERNLQDVVRYSPDILSYLVLTPWHNVFYSKYLKQFRPYAKGGEAILFPGGLAIGLALLCSAIKKSSSKKTSKKNSSLRFRISFVLALVSKIVLLSSLILLIVFMIFSERMSQMISILVLLSIFFASWLLLLLTRSYRVTAPDENEKGLNLSSHDFLHFYILLGCLSFFISLGPTIHLKGRALGSGPFIWLHHWMPGFKALRVSGRIGILAMLSIAIMAGFGTYWLLNVMKKKNRYVMLGLALLLTIFLCYEYAAFPLKLYEMPQETPAVYRWLAEQKGDFAIVEFPLNRAWHLEAPYLYWSTKHWKRIVNGYGAFIPPHFWLLKHYFYNFPSPDYLELLKQYCPIKYVIVHVNEFPTHRQAAFHEWLNSSQISPSLKLKEKFDDSYVLEIFNGGRGSEVIRHYPEYMIRDRKLTFNAKTIDEVEFPLILSIYLNDEAIGTFRLDSRLRYYQLDIPSEQIKSGVNIFTFRSFNEMKGDSTEEKKEFRLEKFALAEK